LYTLCSWKIYSGGRTKILHQEKEKTNIQTKVPPILLMARIIAKKKHERERERERERGRERGVCMFISIYEGR
jgi:hypothetical protein